MEYICPTLFAIVAMVVIISVFAFIWGVLTAPNVGEKGGEE